MRVPSLVPRRITTTAVVVLASVVVAGCGGSARSATGNSGQAGDPERPARVLRLGYFPNLTHATAIVGVQQGIFDKALAPTALEVRTFNAGPAAVEALFSGAIDATYIGPNPAINAFVKSGGKAVRVISGATSGGALLVVRPSIAEPRDLRGKKLATPQLGGTQDVALRYWLRDHGLSTDPNGGGDVSIVPQDNAQTLETFKSGAIDGAWVPEPWATRLVQEGGGRVLVDERTLWSSGRFVTTQLIVRTEFLERYPETVRRLLEGQVRADDFVNQNPAQARSSVNAGIAKITGKTMSEALLEAAWKNLEFTDDPLSSTLITSARHANAVGLLGTVDLKGIYDLTLLNQVLTSLDRAEVKAP